MSVREPFNVEENLVAATAGTGLLLTMIAGLATGFGSEDSDLTRLLLLAGLGLLGAGMALWLVLLRPWEKFDDLQTPYYTGHHHDDHHDDIAHEAVAELHHGEAVLTGGGTSIGVEAEPVVEVNIPSEPVVAHAEDVEPVIEPLAEVAVETETAPVVEVNIPTEPVMAYVEDIEPVIEPLAEVAIEAEDVRPKSEPVVERATLAIADEPVADPEPVVAPITTADTVVFEDDPNREDDLRIIEGIGPKTVEALKASGIKTFAAIANHTPEELERIVKVEHGVRIVGSTVTWRKQAMLAAAGDFSALQDVKTRIKSGYLYDDFTAIEGIDKDIQEALYNAKIRSYDDLAAASLDDIKAALRRAKIESGPGIETWAQQAQSAI